MSEKRQALLDTANRGLRLCVARARLPDPEAHDLSRVPELGAKGFIPNVPSVVCLTLINEQLACFGSIGDFKTLQISFTIA